MKVLVLHGYVRTALRSLDDRCLDMLRSPRLGRKRTALQQEGKPRPDLSPRSALLELFPSTDEANPRGLFRRLRIPCVDRTPTLVLCTSNDKLTFARPLLWIDFAEGPLLLALADVHGSSPTLTEQQLRNSAEKSPESAMRTWWRYNHNTETWYAGEEALEAARDLLHREQFDVSEPHLSTRRLSLKATCLGSSWLQPRRCIRRDAMRYCKQTIHIRRPRTELT